jgi:hypothetical protein
LQKKEVDKMPRKIPKNKQHNGQLVPVYIGLFITVIIILFLGIGNLLFLSFSSSQIAEHFEALEMALKDENWQEANTVFKKTNNHWDNQKAWWQMTIDHKDVEKIDNSFTALYANILTYNSKAAIKELYILQYNLLHIPEVEAISITNIL